VNKNLSSSTKYPLVSIIIVNFNDKKFLESCLDSLFKVDYPNYELIVVDCLTKGIEKFIKEKYCSNIKLVHLDYDVGPAESHNIGAKVARGKYIVFLDNDVEVHPLWLKELVSVIEAAQKNVAAAQSKILLTKEPCKFDCAGGYIDRFGFSFQRGWLEVDKGQYDKIAEVFYAKGASMIVNKETFRKIGGFDDSFFLYYDETDFCWRLLLSGYRVLYVPKSIVFHNVGMKARFSPIRTYHYTKNHVAMLIKNYNLKNLVSTIILVYIYYFGIALLDIKRKRIGVSFAILKGLLWDLINLKQIWANHVYVQGVIRKKTDIYVEQYMIWHPLLFHSIKRFLSADNR